MNEFIKILLSLSISGSLLLLFILALKLLYKNKTSRRWQYYIWIIVVLRFLLPFMPGTINIGSICKKFNTGIMQNDHPAGTDMPAKVSVNNNKAAQRQAQAGKNDGGINAVTVTRNAPGIYFYLFIVWSAMALVLFVRKIFLYQKFVQCIKTGNIEVSDIKTLNLLSDCEEKQNMKARAELYRNAMIASPIMIGFLRPSIILPAGELEDKELYYIFLHELLHYKQRDMFYKWLIQIVVCIHWFNPFVYLLEKEVNKACELSCDEAVISLLDDKARREYGDTLLYFLKPDNLYKNSLASVPLTRGAEQLKERLGVIMNFKKKGRAIRFFMGILTLCILFGANFVGIYPVAAANHTDSVETSKPSMPEDKNSKTATYIYDEVLDFGWYLGNGWDWDDDWDDGDWEWDDDDWDDGDWDWDDDDWNGGDWEWDDDDWDGGDWEWDGDGWDDGDWDWDSDDWDDEALIEAYAAQGIEKIDNLYYYHGELVNILKNQYPDSSFSRISTDLKGTVSIKVTWNTKGEITDVAYMDEEEIEKLLMRALGKTEEIPIINIREWDNSEFLAMEAEYETDNVYILPSPTNKVILKEYLTEDKLDYYASTEIKNKVLTIRSGSRPATNYKSYIEIYIPNDFLDNVKIKTASGAITVDDFTGMMEISTVSGGINVFDANIAGSINTVSGSIGLFPSDVSGDLYVNSNSGTIQAIFPGSVSYKLKAKTETGKLKGSYFEAQSKNKKEFSGSVGKNPKFTITLETFSARIEINESN